ncbi:pep-cterm exosortase interaction domain-containing protein [Leptolyngbya sp. Heron Island J]|uniref:DVUA0089 family protein n=1 Tax=Leptolyngbya sp. Heron Island J TaxID=1385935 RepID=UPI0003B9653A|nr:DVUA0089 family protein [Leptolyngbya sp. Heron Island J]ESA34497.1 pep-cterm exosortase interaction domain-containing protein [Leptolyngbya sp. Heron Island J]
MKPLSTLLGVVTGAMVITLNSTAFAADFSLRGTFAQDDDVHLFNFRVETASTVTLRTYSYAGGTQADGTVIAAGGFDPILSLFDGTGTLITFGDDDETDTVAQDPTTGQAYDSLIEVLLGAGTYTLALTQYNNFSNTNNLADGFRQAGNGNFTSNFSRCTTDRPFCDFTGDIRSNEWAFDALGVLPLREDDDDDKPPVVQPPEPPIVQPPEPPVQPGDNPAQVPEPMTTVAFALVGLGALLHRRKK